MPKRKKTFYVLLRSNENDLARPVFTLHKTHAGAMKYALQHDLPNPDMSRLTTWEDAFAYLEESFQDLRDPGGDRWMMNSESGYDTFQIEELDLQDE